MDENGKDVFLADNQITCNVEGSAKLLGLENSDHSDMGNYNDNRQRVFQGRMIAYIKAEDKGNVKVSFSSTWLGSDHVEFKIE